MQIHGYAFKTKMMLFHQISPNIHDLVHEIQIKSAKHEWSGKSEVEASYPNWKPQVQKYYQNIEFGVSAQNFYLFALNACCAILFTLAMFHPSQIVNT